jgi:sulfocyanin SoxE-like protein
MTSLRGQSAMRITFSFRLPTLLIVWAVLPACAARSQGAPPPSANVPAPAARPALAARDSPIWLVSDSATHTATTSLEVTRPAGAPSALINGYRNGEARIVVPLGWTIKWNWRNADSSSPHSLVVMVQREKIPLEGGRPSFSNAMTRMVSAGLPLGQTDQTTFEAEEAGWYWLLCGVPSHALAGEWLELRVDPEAKAARIEIKNR